MGAKKLRLKLPKRRLAEGLIIRLQNTVKIYKKRLAFLTVFW